MSIRQVVLVSMLISLAATTAVAQTFSLGGRVADPLGGAVNDASVTLTNTGGGVARTTRTAADGTFSIVDLAQGSYVLQIDAAGFRRWSTAVTGAAAALDVVLTIEGVSEMVAVAAPKLEEELPQIVQTTGSRVQTITSAQIENGGYDDVGQALQALVPGLFLTPRSGAFDYIAASLQGSRTNEILWLVDGVRISNRLYNGTTPLDTLPAYMIERIEVLEGGQGLFYGTQAVAGAINVVTKSFTQGASGRLMGGFDTNKGRHLNAFARNSVNGHRFVFYAANDDADGFQPFPDADYQPSTTDRRRSYEVLNFGGKYAYDFSNARLSAMYQRSDVQVDGIRPAKSSASQVGGHAGAFNERVEHIANGKLDVTPNSTTELFFKGFYHRWDSRWSETRNVAARPGTTSVISDAEFWGFKDYGANVMAKLTPTPQVEYIAGYDFQNYSGRDDVLLIAPNAETVHALFGQVRTTPALMPTVTIGAGVRYNAPTNSEKATVWNLSGRYDLPAGMFARAMIGTAFRYPDAYELFAEDPTCCFGNPNLKPETSTNFNASVGRHVLTGATALDVEAIAFFRRVTDLIVDVDDGSGETTVTANRPDKVRVRGVSLVAAGALTNAVSATAGYTYSKSQQTNELAGGYDTLAGIPKNQLEATLDVHPGDVPVGMTLAVNHVGEMFQTVSGFGSVAAGKFTIVDLSGRLFLDRARRNRINIRLENILDEDYTTQHARGFPDAGGAAFLVHTLGVPRTFHMSYSFSF